MKKMTKFRRSVKAISPVISVLLMIAIAVAAALVAYAWVTGYMDFTTTKVGKAIQIQSISTTAVYVQNVGDSKVTLKSCYINGDLDDAATAQINGQELNKSETFTIDDFTNTAAFSGEQITVRIVTTDGTAAEYTETFSDASGDGGPGTTQYSVVIDFGTGGALVSPASGSYSGDVAISATADTDYVFNQWTSTGSITFLSASSASTTATINGAGTITATFTYVPPNPETLTLRPNGDGTYTQLSEQGSGSSHYTKVDDIGTGDGDSTYVYKTNQGDDWRRDTYATQDTGATGTINSITVYARCRDSQGSGQGRIAIRTNSQNFEEGDTDLNTGNWQLLSYTWNDNPATASAWTWSEINALEIGVELQETSFGNEIRCTQVYVVVEYTP